MALVICETSHSQYQLTVSNAESSGPEEGFDMTSKQSGQILSNLKSPFSCDFNQHH